MGDWTAFLAGLIVGALIGFSISLALGRESGVVIERDKEGRIVGLIPVPK